MEIERWYKQQYVQEVQTRFAYSMNPNNRLGMIYSWRIRPHISVWTTLPGEKPPVSWSCKPSIAVLNKQAHEAWERCDKAQAQKLYEMWNHACTDPYYCPMHGIGSN